MNTKGTKTTSTPTLCWDCAKAVMGCSWSKYFKPVKGWKIIPTKKEVSGGTSYKSCIVLECPEFERDGANGGTLRYKDGEIYKPKVTDL